MGETSMPEGREHVTAAAQATDLQRLSLRKNLGFSSFAMTYQALTQFTVIAITARLGGAEDVGLLTLSAAIVIPLFFLTSLGMRDVHTVDDLSRFTNADYVALRVLGGSTAVLLAAGIAFLGYDTRDLTLQATILAFALLRFFWSQAGLAHAMCQRAERLDLVALSIVVRCSLGLLVFGLIFWKTNSLVAALSLEAMSALVVYLFLDRRLLTRIGARVPLSDLFSVNARPLLQLLIWTLPLGVALWLGRSVSSVPPIVLEHEAGLVAVGLFGALAYAHTGLSILATGFHNASAARLRRHYRLGERHGFWMLTGKLTMLSATVGFLATVIAFFFGDAILTVVFGPEYADHVLLTVIVGASSMGLLATPLTTVIASAHAFRMRLCIAAVAFGVTAIAALLFVPHFGAIGAAWALFTGLGAQLCAALVVVFLLFGKGRKGHNAA